MCKIDKGADMKIALGQLALYWEDKESNLKKVSSCLELLASKGVSLFLLPEMSLTGFSMHTDRTKESKKETVKKTRELAEKYQITIGIGWVKDMGSLCENHYSLVAPEGELLDYAKIHPFRYGKETEYFQGGTSLALCRCEDFQVGVQICYDLRFPEPFQRLSTKADLIVVPANWPAARKEHWSCLLRARAIENMSYIAGVNCTGEMGGQYYSGDSAIYAPDGTMLTAEVLYLDRQNTEQIQLYNLTNDVCQYRSAFPVKEDRKEDLYCIL